MTVLHPSSLALGLHPENGHLQRPGILSRRQRATPGPGKPCLLLGVSLKCGRCCGSHAHFTWPAGPGRDAGPPAVQCPWGSEQASVPGVTPQGPIIITPHPPPPPVGASPVHPLDKTTTEQQNPRPPRLEWTNSAAVQQPSSRRVPRSRRWPCASGPRLPTPPWRRGGSSRTSNELLYCTVPCSVAPGAPPDKY